MPPASKITSVTINRAPVMTLWAAVVAERLGFSRDEALTLGKAVAGLNAQSKGKRLGIYGKPEPPRTAAAEAARKARETKPGAALHVELMHREVPVVRTPAGLRAGHGGKPMSAESVERYLATKFKDALGAAREAMEALAGAFEPPDLAARAFALYEEMRPVIPRGKRGWGVAGVLDLELIRSLSRPGRGPERPR
jgi:hypothetical protein